MLDYHIGWTILGIVVVLALTIDAIVTTLLLSGAGFLSKHLSRCVGRVCMGSQSKFLSKNASVFALIATFFLWTFLLWLGWSLIFCGTREAVLASENQTPADLLSRIYFAGFTVTTLGTGNYIPNGPIWQMFSVAAAANGFFIVTICVTYTFSVLNALNERRAIGVAVGHLGDDPISILSAIGDDSDRSLLTSRLQELTQQLETASVKTDTYPVVEYTHVPDDEHSFAVSVARLGEICLLNTNVLSSEVSLSAIAISPLWRAVEMITDETRENGRQMIEYPVSQITPHLGTLPTKEDWQQTLHKSAASEQYRQLSNWLVWHHRDWKSVYPNLRS